MGMPVINLDRFRSFGSERSSSPDDWTEALEEAMALTDYPANWDGEGAQPVSKALQRSVLALMLSLRDRSCHAPDGVSPMAGGTVMLEWHGNDRIVLSVEIREPEHGEVLIWHPEREPEFGVVTWGPKRPSANRRVFLAAVGLGMYEIVRKQTDIGWVLKPESVPLDSPPAESDRDSGLSDTDCSLAA